MKLKQIALWLVLALGALGVQSSHAQSWSSDPVISGQGCENLDYFKIATFLEKYYYSTLVYSSNEQAAGRQMLENYSVASSLILRSQSCLAEALELKKLTDKLKKQQLILSSGTSLSARQMKKQRRLTAEANAEIEAAAAALEQLTPEQRERFSKGVAAYMTGTYATARLFRTAGDYVAATAASVGHAPPKKKNRLLGRIPGMDKATEAAGTATDLFKKTKGAGLVFKGLKDHTIDLYQTSQFLREYSTKNNIEVPQEASDNLASVGDWV